MQIDSGADANVINENTYNTLVPKPHLWQASSKLKPYSSKPIHVKGYFMANFQVNGKKSESKVYVTNGNKCNNLLGLRTLWKKWKAQLIGSPILFSHPKLTQRSCE